MGMRKKRCPGCKKERVKAPAGDSNPNVWRSGKPDQIKVCTYCQKKFANPDIVK